MTIEVSQRLEGIGEYYFSQKLREIEALNKAGKQIINLGIGSPDLPPHANVIAALHTEAAKPTNHAYQSYKGNSQFRNAIASFYNNWYNVQLDPETEILPLIGSKEGIMHVCMTYLNKGDIALIPNPGYPTYKSAVALAGGLSVNYNLKEENNWEPDYEELASIIKINKETTGASPIKLMWLNYPHMPTGRQASVQLFKKLVQFAADNNILLCHDNPYSFILNKQPLSILSVPGAKEVAIELNSLSKASNMAGWRVGFLSGAKQRVDEILRFKSNMDSGMFLPVQLAATKALLLGKDWYDGLNGHYAKRRELVYKILEAVRCTFDKSQGGMFIWAKVSGEYADGYKLSDEVLYNKNVFITPGGIFGSNGNGYIRVSLCANEMVLQNALDRINA